MPLSLFSSLREVEFFFFKILFFYLHDLNDPRTEPVVRVFDILLLCDYLEHVQRGVGSLTLTGCLQRWMVICNIKCLLNMGKNRQKDLLYFDSMSTQ